MNRNIRLIIAYNGAKYHGFQKQPGKATIQGTLESSLEKVLYSPVKVTGCSRTDTGVHAREYVCGFSLCNAIPPEKLTLALENVLPEDIAVLDLSEVPADFHARRSVAAKEYVYLFDTRAGKDVFMSGKVYRYPHEIDVERLNRAAKIFTGTHDFTAFSKTDPSLKRQNKTVNPVKTILSSNVHASAIHETIIEFSVMGSGFLYNMVRIMAGTLILLNENKIKEADITEMLERKSDVTGKNVLPGCGLYLNRVFLK
ncbi:tRNA pseudouridine synthase A [Clostridia bacterium]|nr:tRNA pseudouridine synthase A [Clostridia bacterium]